MKKSNKIIRLLILCCMLSSLFLPVFQAADWDNNAVVWLVPSSEQIEIDSDFNVTVYINPGGVQCSQFNILQLYFNETYLWMTNTTGFDFVNAWDGAFDDATPDNATGKYTNIGSFLSGGYPTTNISGVILNFTAQTVGVLYMNVTNLPDVREPDNDKFTVDWNNLTLTIHPGSPGTDISTSEKGYSYINLSWTQALPNGASQFILYNESSGVELYNGTNTWYNDTGLANGTTYYYSLYSYNVTEDLLSLDNQTHSETTGTPNAAPVLSSPSPSNGSTIAYTTTRTVQITINDPEGDSISGYINSSGDSQAISGGNNTYSNALSGLSDGDIIWYVNVTDGNNTVVEWFTFHINAKPSGGGGGGDWDEDPENAAPSVSVASALSVDVNDTEGDFVTVNFYWGNSTLIGMDTVPSGDGVASVTPGHDMAYGTEYTWYVVANDSLDSTRGPASGTWSFNTSDLGIDITKEWIAVSANNSVQSWINVTNTGSTNLTNVWIWDMQHTSLAYAGSNYTAWMNGHLRFNITYLNVSVTKTIIVWYDLNYSLDNGDCLWNHANVSHLSMTDTVNISDLCYSYTLTKEVNETSWEENQTYTYWINITNNGNFTLQNLWVNDTYDANSTYVSNSSSPSFNESVGNNSWLFYNVTPGATITITIVVNATGVNGSYINNTVTTNTSLGATGSAYVDSYIGVHTESLRVRYTSEQGNILQGIFSAIGLMLVLMIVLVAITIFVVISVLRRKGEQL